MVVVASFSYLKWFENMLTGEWNHNFTISQLFVDEFHETKSDKAPIPAQIEAYKKDIVDGIQEAHKQGDDEPVSE